MKALLCTELGSLDKLTVQDVPSPRAGPNQVVIDVKAIATVAVIVGFFLLLGLVSVMVFGALLGGFLMGMRSGG